MGQAQLEIVLTDSGQTAGSGVGEGAPPGSTAQARASNAPPTHPIEQPKPKEDKEREPTSISDALYVLSRTFGFQQIQGATELLIRAFSELNLVVTKRSAQTATEGPETREPPRSVTYNVPKPTGAAAPPPAAVAAEGAAAGEATAGAAEAAEGAAVGGEATAAAGGLAALGGPITLVIAGLGALGFALGKLTSAVNSDADRLAEYSAELATAQAQVQLRQQLAEIERAQRMGPQLAEFENTTSKLWTDIYKILGSFEEMFITVWTPIFKIIEPNLKLIADFMKVIADLVAAIVSGMQLQFDKAGKALDRTWKDLKEMVDDYLNPDESDPLAPDPFTAMLVGDPIGVPGQNRDHQQQPNDNPLMLNVLAPAAGVGVQLIKQLFGGI